MRQEPPEEESLLLLYFTPDELAALTPEEIRLLAALAHEDIPEVPEQERLQAARDYRERVLKKLAEQTSPPAASHAPDPG